MVSVVNLHDFNLNKFVNETATTAIELELLQLPYKQQNISKINLQFAFLLFLIYFMLFSTRLKSERKYKIKSIKMSGLLFAIQ